MSELKSTNLSAALNAAKLNASLNSTIRLNDYIITLEEIEGGHRLTARKGDSVQSMDIMDGTDGEPGKDGISPIITVTDIDGGHRVTITDAQGVKEVDVMDGQDGQGGGLPEGGAAHQMLVTDADGNTKWEDRTHYEIPPKFDIRWDGDMTGRFALPMDDLGFPGAYMVKVSDLVLTPEEMIGGYFYINDSYIDVIHVGTDTYPGCYVPNNDTVILVVHDQTAANSALGLPDDTVTNGVYFYAQPTQDIYVARFRGPVEFVKLDEKYLPDKVMSGIVRYDVSMVKLLSEQEKMQARNNIGAANELSSTARESVIVWLSGKIGAADFEDSTIPELKNSITTYIDLNAFIRCRYLRLVDLPNLEYIGAGAFAYCGSLFTVILRRSDKIVTLANSNAFENSLIYNGGQGFIYVPASMVDAYKADANWYVYDKQIRAIEDYPGITGG